MKFEGLNDLDDKQLSTDFIEIKTLNLEKKRYPKSA